MKKIEIAKILEWHNSGTLKTDEAVERIFSLFNVVGRSEQFYCDGQENNKDRCETQCLGCAGMQEIYGQ